MSPAEIIAHLFGPNETGPNRKLNIRDLAFSAFMAGKKRGTDWCNDTEPDINAYLDQWRSDLEAALAAEAPVAGGSFDMASVPIAMELVDDVLGDGKVCLAQHHGEAAFLVLYSDSDDGGVSGPIAWRPLPGSAPPVDPYERAAKVADEHALATCIMQGLGDHTEGARLTARSVAAIIRALKEG